MSEILIEVEFVATGKLGWSRERIAYRQFSDGIADMSPNAKILGAKDENEESEIRMTIKSIGELRGKRSPETIHWHLRKYLEKNDILNRIYDEVEGILLGEQNVAMKSRQLEKKILEKHPEWENTDVERRIRELHTIGWLAKPAFGLYMIQPERWTEIQMNPYYKKQREITA